MTCTAASQPLLQLQQSVHFQLVVMLNQAHSTYGIRALSVPVRLQRVWALTRLLQRLISIRISAPPVLVLVTPQQTPKRAKTNAILKQRQQLASPIPGLITPVPNTYSGSCTNQSGNDRGLSVLGDNGPACVSISNRSPLNLCLPRPH